MRFAKNLAVFALMLAVVLPSSALDLNVLGSYQSLVFDEGAAEIVAFDHVTDVLYITNANANTVDRLDISDPSNPALLGSIDLAPYGDGVNSVAFSSLGYILVAVEADPSTDPGKVVFFDQGGMYEGEVTVGALPDMVAVSPDGTTAMVACEGEPDGGVNPQGSAWEIDIATQQTVEYNFTQWDGQEDFLTNNLGVLLEPGVPASLDLEPEYVAFDSDGSFAFVACQEQGAIVSIDLDNNSIYGIFGAAPKDHSLPGNGLDASNDDDMINIANWPVFGMYQGDAIAYAQINNQGYVFVAVEGDARDDTEARVHDLDLDDAAFPDEANLLLDENLGRLHVRTDIGDIDNDGDYDMLYSYGTRSMGVFETSFGGFISDTGDEFEQIIATMDPDNFNSNNDENDSFDARSDDKGPEPEAIAVGQVDGDWYAFIGLERQGGIMVYDVNDPANPEFVTYLNNRNFDPALDPDVEDDLALIGDLGPEDIKFVEPSHSPTGDYMLIVANEVSGSLTFYSLDTNDDPIQVELTPESDDIVVDAPGSFMFDVMMTNTTNQSGSVQAWIEVTTPANMVVVPSQQEVTFGAGTVIDVDGLMQAIPGYAPAGEYTFTVKVGFPGPDLVYGSDSFTFTVIDNGTDGTNPTGEWVVSGFKFETAGEGDQFATAPISFGLSAAYPNPFNPTTSVNVTMPNSGELSVAVYNTVGQQVAELANGHVAAGTHSFTFDAGNLSSGVYLVRASSAEGVQVRKVTLMK